MKKGKFYKVTWLDAKGVSPAWERAEEIKKDGLCRIVSCGKLIYQNKREVVIAAHVTAEGDCCGEMHIPRSTIIKTKQI